MKKTALIIGAGTMVLVVADQFTKLLAGAYLRESAVYTDWLNLGYRENTGIAWSIQVPYPLLLVLNFVLIVGFFWFAAGNFDFGKWMTRLAVMLVTAGACGNIIDRLDRGFVVDFISVWIWPVFNLADIFLTVGIFLILLFYAKIKRTIRDSGELINK